MLSPIFKPVRFADLPGWAEDDPFPAFVAFRRSAFHVLEKPYRSGSLGIHLDALEPVFADSRETIVENATEARQFFEKWFVPCLIVSGQDGQGFVTSYYEPEVMASPVWTESHRFPLLSRPADLVDIDDSNRPADLDPYHAFARNDRGRLIEYYDRKAIETGALAERGLEIAFVEDPVDAFFIHVQGAARLNMTAGSKKRITYAAKSGHRFTGPGGILVSMGEIAADHISMQAIRCWFASHPERVDEILWQNRSYIFFREAPVDDPHMGPVAAAKVPLTAGRSVAVDRLLHTFGTPFYIHAENLTSFDSRPFRRLMIAQDTGSAILGAARGDLFAGSGDEAGMIAGAVRHAADFYTLVPRSLLGH
ncbi:MAG: murein transglycosylase A [Phyllobacterium sp.]